MGLRAGDGSCRDPGFRLSRITRRRPASTSAALPNRAVLRSRRRAARAAGQAPAPGLRPWEAPAGRAPGCTVHRTSISGLLAPSHAGASPPAPIGQPSPKRAPVIRTRELPTRHAAGSSLHPHGGPAPLESRWRPPKQRPAPTGHRRSPKKSLGASQRVRGDTTPHPLVNDQCLPESVKQPENRKLSQTETFHGQLDRTRPTCPLRARSISDPGVSQGHSGAGLQSRCLPVSRSVPPRQRPPKP